jgi:FAD/FMN-containing dehydrogenase
MTTKARPQRKAQDVVYNKLKKAIGQDKIKLDELALTTYAFDVSPRPFTKPSMIILPESKEDVRQVLLVANEYKIPVTILGSGITGRGLTLPSERGIVLDFRRMNKVLEINTDSGYAVIEPGTNFDKFSGELAKKGYRCHLGTAPGGASTLGNYLLRSSGSMGNRHLDSIVDLEVVLPDGTILKTGSSHFPGVGSHMRYGPYPDLTGLYCCAYGTLGVITKAAIRIYPVNEATRVAVAQFDSFASAVDFMKDIINNNIPEHAIIWNWQLYKVFEISNPDQPLGAFPKSLTQDPSKAPKDIPYCLVTSFLSGYTETLDANEKVMAKVAKKYGGKALTQAEAEALVPGSMKGWEQLFIKYRPVVPLALFGLGKYMPWIVCTEPRQVKELEKWAVAEIDKEGARPVCYYSQPFDFGRSIFFRIFVFPEHDKPEIAENVQKTYARMYREAMKKYGAHPYRHNPGQPFVFETGGYYTLLKKIKDAIDPNNILSPQVALFKEEE